MKRFLTLFVCMLTLTQGMLGVTKNQFVIVLDAGHGGRDAGAVRKGYKEKVINLAVALEVGRLVKANLKDVKVVYTRDDDQFVELSRRSEIANKAKANLFVSIHTNSTAARTTTVSGADSYILGLSRSEENLEVAKRENSVILYEDDYTTKYEGFDPNSPESYIIFEFMTNKYIEQSLEVASYVQSHFRSTANRVDRGVKQAGFLVLRQSSMPSLLIELGFINNPNEAKYLYTSSGQNEMAKSIYLGIKEYKEEFDKKQANIPGNTAIDSTPKTQEVVVDTKTYASATDEALNSDKQVEYRIQLLSSTKKYPKKSSIFKGLSPVDSYKETNLHKYVYGSSTSLEEIEKLRSKVKAKFPDCFIVHFVDGKRVK